MARQAFWSDLNEGVPVSKTGKVVARHILTMDMPDGNEFSVFRRDTFSYSLSINSSAGINKIMINGQPFTSFDTSAKEQMLSNAYIIDTNQQNGQIEILIHIEDVVGNEIEKKIILNVINMPPPSIAFKGEFNTTQSVRRKDSIEIPLSIIVPEKLSKIEILYADGTLFELADISVIDNPENFIYTYIVPKYAKNKQTIEFKFVVYDEVGQVSTEDLLVVLEVQVEEIISTEISFQDTTIYTGTTISFEDNSVGIVNERMWEFGGGSISDSIAKSVTVYCEEPGEFEIKLTLKNRDTTVVIITNQKITVLEGHPITDNAKGQFYIPEDNMDTQLIFKIINKNSNRLDAYGKFDKNTMAYDIENFTIAKQGSDTISYFILDELKMIRYAYNAHKNGTKSQKIVMYQYMR